MEKYKCNKNVYGRQCDDSFRTETQLRQHITSDHKKITIVKDEQPVIPSPFAVPPRKLQDTDVCIYCGSKAFIIEDLRPLCYGSWTTWGCHYSKGMIERDRRLYKQPCRMRHNYDPRPLTKNERRKLIKAVVSLEKLYWSPISWTPLDELEMWHDDKLRREIRNLEDMGVRGC